MNRFDIINRIGDKYRVGNTETGEFSYAQALKTVGKDIKDYQKATTGTQHKFLDIRFENERLVVLVECKNKFSRWDKAKIQGQLQDYVRFEKAYSDKKIVAILAETDGDEVWVWFGQSVIIDDEHRMEEETVLRTFEEYENLCFGRVNDKIKVVDSIKTLNEKLHSDGINEKLRSQFVGTCLLALKNGLVYKNVKETLDPKTGKKLAPERVVLKSIKDILEGLLTRGGSLNKAGKLAVLNSKVLDDQDVTSLTYKELEDILQFIDDNVVPYINDKSTAGQDLLNLFFIYAVNPKNLEDRQVKSHRELEDLFPYYPIPAERILGEDGTQKNESLSSLVADYFNLSEEELTPDIAEKVKELRSVVDSANKDVQKESDRILSDLVNKAVGFGYPNIEELQLGVTTELKIDDQIKNQTRLSYSAGTGGESLPSTHNGLGYKNLIKMEFLLAAFARDVEKKGEACIPLLFIEEPESHMHPQMQHAFAEHLENFLAKITTIHIQTFLTTHSAHIANTMDFSKIRYAQKSKSGVVYKNLDVFAKENADNMDFIKKYLTLSRCDLFFADKIIFVEGASERLMLPDMKHSAHQICSFCLIRLELGAILSQKNLRR